MHPCLPLSLPTRVHQVRSSSATLAPRDHVPARPPAAARPWTRWLLPLLIGGVVVATFLPALGNGFVAWDDDKNFLDNPHYRGLGLVQLRWMWTTFHLGHYVPLTWMTLGLDYLLWGMNPAGYHLTNVLLQAANAVVVYFLARRLLRFGEPGDTAGDEWSLGLAAAFAALVFALHPLRVESVAWVTERRDVLSGLFFNAATLTYLRTRDAGSHRGLYAASLVLFGCALLSKATAMTLPAVLLILNVYPLRRLGIRPDQREAVRDIALEVLPFALLAAGAAALSVVALHPPTQLGVVDKVAVSARSLAFYLWKTIAPVRLSPVYEMPQRVEPFTLLYVASYGAVLATTVLAVMAARRWPGVTAALAAFTVITLPMLGAVQNGPQIAADRYTYHAAPALAMLAGGGLMVAWRRYGRTALGFAVAALLALATLTWRQTLVWRDSASLWSHVVRLDDDSSIGHVGLANVLLKQDSVDAAMEHARRAVAIAPGYAQAHNDLGVALARRNRLTEAVDQYEQALTLEPSDDEAQNNWGVVLARQGDLAGAIEHYQRALAANPDHADSHVNWGNALVRSGAAEAAIPHYEAALRIRPNDADAEHNWGVALARQGRFAEAVEHFQRAIDIDPGYAEARVYLERATRLLRQQQ